MQARFLKSIATTAAGLAILLMASPVAAPLAAQSGQRSQAGQAGAQQQAGAQTQPPQQPQQPVFRAEIERVRVDVQVVNSSKGDPVIGLGLDDFEVWLDGRPRRVTSAELVTFEHEPLPAQVSPTTVRTPGRVPEDARVFIVAVDQLGLPVAAIAPMKETIRRFLAQLRPQDMVALYEFPYRTPKLDISHDHSLVARALDRVMGMRTQQPGSYNLSASEIVDIAANDADTLNHVVARECGPVVGVEGDIGCLEGVRAEARGLAAYLEVESSQRMNELVKLAQTLSFIPGRKTIVLMSGGLITSSKAGGRPDIRSMLAAVGDDIANAQANLYVIHLDSSMTDAYGAPTRGTRISNTGMDTRSVDRFQTLTQDRATLITGLEVLAGRAGGAMFSVDAGTPASVFDRVLLETRAYYVLGVEPADEDRDGKSHYIRVKTTAKHADVRSRVQVFIPQKK
jgi:VWFA-related protein